MKYLLSWLTPPPLTWYLGILKRSPPLVHPLQMNRGYSHQRVSYYGAVDVKGRTNKDQQIIGLVIPGRHFSPCQHFHILFRLQLEESTKSFVSQTFDQNWWTELCRMPSEKLQVSWNSSWSAGWLVRGGLLRPHCNSISGQRPSNEHPRAPSGHAFATSNLATFNGHRTQNPSIATACKIKF